MDPTQFLWNNKEMFKLLFTVAVGLICLAIVLKTHRLFKISSHQGIRYFRNAFFFYGIGFSLKYILEQLNLILSFPFDYSPISSIVFEFFVILAGISLVYSLFWKKFEPENGIHSSLFNLRFLIFYFLSFIVVFLDYLWHTHNFMFIVQMILFFSATATSYSNYQKSKDKEFTKLYFAVIFLNLGVWIVNFLVATLFEWNKKGVMLIYLVNLIIFTLFLYIVFKITNKKKL